MKECKESKGGRNCIMNVFDAIVYIQQEKIVMQIFDELSDLHQEAMS